MEWQQYKALLIAEAQAKGYSDEKLLETLDYANNLINKSLPVIYDLKHLSLLVGYKTAYIQRATHRSQFFYRRFEIRKKSGATRVIFEPLPSLKEIQLWILKNILNNCPISKYAKAYVRKKSIKDAARFHKNQKYVVTIDIVQFFEFINYPTVLGKFILMGYSREVSTILTKLCCKNDSLPQGAPTSPSLSNIVFADIDFEISEYCYANNIRYTRYADDLIFSGDLEPKLLIGKIEGILLNNGFILNNSKTRIMRPWQRQIVTGLIVNEKSKVQVPIEARRKLRQEMYYINKFGLDSHLSYTKNYKAKYLIHLLGVAKYMFFINPNDTKVANYIYQLESYINN
ncbi:reverse transcriptase family protein [Hymenobacter jejuensis]|uniref:RNA-directed DNA polymerase n=1 Tax=Hymenobacter jejuensis TaxID=2502781 RepID=A0A5B7ZXV5_9BACT|nr:reverse transcriptase family protein [Hymenobacter jejuensis]QDA59994.1 RNA-directed DNA polymerase [Hymenobacter jejuensis]